MIFANTQGIKPILVAASNASNEVKKNARYVCDGVDDQVQINAAIQSLIDGPTTNARTGGVLLLSAGTFTISAAIVVDRSIRISGTTSGLTQIIQADGANINLIELQQTYDSAPSSLNIIERLFLHGNKNNNSSGWGIYQYDADTVAATDLRVLDCWFESNPSGGIYLQRKWNHQINKCTFEHGADNAPAIYLGTSDESPTLVHITNNMLLQYDHFIKTAVPGAGETPPYDVIVANNHVHCYKDAITFAGDNWSITGNIFGITELDADNVYSSIVIDSDRSLLNYGSIVIANNTWQGSGATNNLKHYIDIRGPYGYDIVDSATYQWTNSPTDTDEYYLELLGGGDPGLSEPAAVIKDDEVMIKGTVGALGLNRWAWGDNDSLGYNTIYMRLSGNADPDTLGDGGASAINANIVVSNITITGNASKWSSTGGPQTSGINLAPIIQASAISIIGNSLKTLGDTINLETVAGVTISGNYLSSETGKYAIVADSDAHYLNIADNLFLGTGGGMSFPSGPSATYPPLIHNNTGYVTDNCGAASVADGGTIAHGLAGTPDCVEVTGSVAGEIITVTSIDATNITVAIKTNAGAAGTSQTVYWKAKYKP